MIIIGVDPHKRVHTATAVDAATNRRLASLEIDASLPGYRQLARWANGFAEHTWAVENARGLGRHLAQWLVARGERVDDVTSTATARVRELSRGGRRKNDVIDAAAAASVAALHGDANPVAAEDLTRCWCCSTSAAATSPPSGPGWSTSFTPYSETSFPAAHRPG